MNLEELEPIDLSEDHAGVVEHDAVSSCAFSAPLDQDFEFGLDPQEPLLTREDSPGREASSDCRPVRIVLFSITLLCQALNFVT